MQRDDWVFVGVRLLGVYYVAGAVSGAASLLALVSERQLFGELNRSTVFLLGGKFLVGVFLCLGAPSLLAWLKQKDSRVVLTEGEDE